MSIIVVVYAFGKQQTIESKIDQHQHHQELFKASSSKMEEGVWA
jgi:hypothetical protein